MLLKQLVEIKALKESAVKNEIMDVVEDACRNADIPHGTPYARAVQLIVKAIQNTDTYAAEVPATELTGYVKDYFPRDEYEESLKEDEDYSQEQPQDQSQDQEPQQPKELDQPPQMIGKAGDYLVLLDQKTEMVTITKNGQNITEMPLVIWTQLKRQ